jgi:UDP-glucose 4-epimerase
MLDNQIGFISGGTGTFGNAVVLRLLGAGVHEIRVFSRDEKKQDDMRRHYADSRLKFYIGDVRDGQSVDFVFHAAALKQVPSCEFFPIEAVRTNVLGAENVLNAAITAGVRSVIVLSTDKAVYPINAMGMSKALMEKLALAKSRVAGRRTTVCCTRYGNVMGSRGSVIPLFIRQMQAGQPFSITDPLMTRFMMSIGGAVDLVLWAFEHGHPGDIFVQKSHAATIETLALAMQQVFKADNPIRLIGTRHGEKQHETLLTREDVAVAEDMGKYYRVAADARDLNYGMYFDSGRSEVSVKDDYNSFNAKRLTVGEMAELLLSLDIVQRALAGENISD